MRRRWRGGWRLGILTGFDIARGVNDTCSGAACAYVDSDVVIYVRIQVVVRTSGSFEHTVL
jgi:hypothetical protein